MLLYSLTRLINLCAKGLMKKIRRGDRLKALWRSRAGKSDRTQGGAVIGMQAQKASPLQGVKGN